jgi:universal stress protein A
MKTPSKPDRSRLTISVKPGTAGEAVGVPTPNINLVPALLGLKSILVPIDFSWPSKKALQYAIPFAQQFGARITLLFVMEPPVYTGDIGYVPLEVDDAGSMLAISEKLAELAQQAMPPDLLAKTLVRTGRPFQEIVDAARELDTDLIVIATHGYTGLKHVFLGSTVERVVRHAPCPVLTVREGEHEFV